jgi:predicted nucleic acid-binding Zn ribbon protein
MVDQGMNKQQKMLMSAERAIKRLAKLAWHISHENLVEWIIHGDKLGECKADDLFFVATWLSDCVEGGIRKYEYSKPHLACIVCGKDSQRLEARRHARYCSDRCRQKAYRQRNGSGNETRKQTVTNGEIATFRDGSCGGPEAKT